MGGFSLVENDKSGMHGETQPCPRSAAVFCRISQQRLILLCGDSGEPGHRFGDVWQLDIDASIEIAGAQHGTWSQLQPLGATYAAAPRSNAAAAVVGGQYVVMFGGWDSSGITAMASLAVLDLSVCAWLNVSDRTAAHTSDMCIVNSSSSQISGDHRLHNGDEVGCRGTGGRHLGPCPSARGQPSLAALTDASGLLLFGGWDGKSRHNDLWHLDAATWQWQVLQPAGVSPPKRADHSGVMWRYCDCGHWKDILVVFGGSCSEGLLNDVWLFDVDTDTWRQAHCGGKLPCPRSSHAAVLIGGSMLVSGGRTADALADDLVMLDLTTLMWTVVPPQSPPMQPLCRHSMAATGTVRMTGPPDNAADAAAHDIWSTPSSDAATAEFDVVSVQNTSAAAGGRVALENGGSQPSVEETIASKEPAVWVFGGFDGESTRGELLRLQLPVALTDNGDAAAKDGQGPSKQAQAPLQISDLEDADAVMAMPAWKQIRRLHTTAVAAEMEQYIDPPSGYSCWTAHYLKQRPCCGNACRHCPYGHKNVVKA